MRIAGLVTDDRLLLDRFASLMSDRRASIAQTLAPEVMFAAGEGIGLAVIVHESASMAALDADLPLPERDAEESARSMLRQYLSEGSRPMSAQTGQFALALWDQSSSRLILYRDRAGVPPMFYSRVEGGLLWSTDMETILAMGVDREVDQVGLVEYQLIGYVQSPRTFVRSIGKLPAAHRLVYEGGAIDVERFWQPSWTPKLRSSVEGRAVDLRGLVSAAVTRMTPASGKVGVLLSSGIDSTSVAAVAAGILDLDIHTFTFLYGDDRARYNEGLRAERVARALGARHEQITIGPEYVVENLPRLLVEHEEPMSYALHSVRMGPVRDAGIDVVLTGAQGAQWELPTPLSRAIDLADVAPRQLLEMGRRLTSHQKRRGLAGVSHMLSLAVAATTDRYLSIPQQRLMRTEIVSGLYRDRGLVDSAVAVLHQDLANAIDGAVLAERDRLALLGLSSFGPDHLLWWSHRWTRAAGVSVRFPLLDPDYLDYMSRRRKRNEGKEDLRMMASELIPADLSRTHKIPQSVPLTEWLRGPMRDFVTSHLTADALESDGHFDTATVLKYRDEHLAGTADHRWVVWTCMCYLLWREHYLRR